VNGMLISKALRWHMLVWRLWVKCGTAGMRASASCWCDEKQNVLTLTPLLILTPTLT